MDETLFQLIKDANIHNPNIQNPIWKIATYLTPEDQHLRLTLVLEHPVTDNWYVFFFIYVFFTTYRNVLNLLIHF